MNYVLESFYTQRLFALKASFLTLQTKLEFVQKKTVFEKGASRKVSPFIFSQLIEQDIKAFVKYAKENLGHEGDLGIRHLF